MAAYCGIDWAENHHDIALIDHDGALLAQRRISDDAHGFDQLLELLAEHGDTAEDPIPVALETGRGLLVAALRTGRREVYAVNPLSAARYRDRHHLSRAKSDAADARVLADILRTDRHAHRPLPEDSEQVQGLAVVVRAQQDAAWNRQALTNEARSLLREFYPAALEAFHHKQHGLARAEARTVLAAAPTPARAAELSLSQLESALHRAGRQRGIAAEARRLHEVLRAAHARQPTAVEQAMGTRLLALIRQLDAACVAADELAAEVEASFRAHPDAEILLSFPGLGVLTGARVLAEIGDDRARFADARGLKAYAGSAPITRASGKKRFVGRRFIKNDRLLDAGFLWAFCALTNSPGAKAHYRRRRDHGDWHAQAQRHLFNRMLGQLFHCLQTGRLYDEHRAFTAENTDLAEAA